MAFGQITLPILGRHDWTDRRVDISETARKLLCYIEIRHSRVANMDLVALAAGQTYLYGVIWQQLLQPR